MVMMAMRMMGVTNEHQYSLCRDIMMMLMMIY